MQLLLLSSSRAGKSAYLEHAIPQIQSHLGKGIERVLFVPYAGVTISYDEYAAMVADVFVAAGYQLESLHQHASPRQALESAQAIIVGGGNTFALLNELYRQELIQAIAQKVRLGCPYIGWSAGSNISAPTICTTNDMPIVQPPSFDALNLLPFQLNPHYIEGSPPGFHGETREQRLAEYLVCNPQSTVLGLPEGTALTRSGNRLTFVGEVDGFLLTAQNKVTLAPGTDLSHLLSAAAEIYSQ